MSMKPEEQKGIMERCPVCGVVTLMKPAFNTKVGDIIWYCTACEYYMSAPAFAEYVERRAKRAVASTREKNPSHNREGARR